MDMDMAVDMIWICKCTHIHVRETNKFKMQILGSMGPPPWEDITVPATTKSLHNTKTTMPKADPPVGRHLVNLGNLSHRLLPDQTTKMFANSVKYMFGTSILYLPWHQLESPHNTRTTMQKANPPCWKTSCESWEPVS